VNIAIVVHYYDRNEGTGGYAVELLTRLASEHEITLYTAGVRTDVPTGVRVVRVPAARGRAYATILTFPFAFAAVRAQHEIVHAQGWVASNADVVTAHIVLAAWRDRARAAGVRSAWGERLFGGLVTGREASLYRRSARCIIAPSQKVREELARYYGRTDAVHVIPHGFPGHGSVLPRSEARKQLGLPQEVLLALYIGDARKGLDAALEAVAAAPAFHLLVLSASRADRYLAQAQRLGLGDRLHWAGHLSNPKPAYAAADVLLHPTIYDSFGLAVAEAMASGLPPIVSRAAGIAELLTHGESGWLLAADSTTEAATALRTLAKDAALLQRLAQGAQAVVERRTWDDVAQETLAVYELARARAGRR
jgi:glycosyltransferase involved in cell wall biosynthesis